MGAVAVLKKHDVEFELTAPDIISAKQKSIEDDEGDGSGDNPRTPEEALANGKTVANDAAWPFPTAGADQAKKSRRKAVT
jgi:hypothetical protein